jgi:hypothetical protein
MTPTQKLADLNKAAKSNVMVQPFILEALDYYATQVIQNTPDSDDGKSLISPKLWKTTAQTVADIVNAA